MYIMGGLGPEYLSMTQFSPFQQFAERSKAKLTQSRISFIAQLKLAVF